MAPETEQPPQSINGMMMQLPEGAPSYIRPAPLQLPDVAPDTGTPIAILVPLCNYRQYITQCLESILSQTYRDLEIVIVDNASTDGSFEIAREVCGEDPRVTIHRNENRVGIVENFRLCYERSSAPLVRFVTADDGFLVPHAVSRLVSAIESAPDVVLATSRCIKVDAHGDTIEGAGIPEHPSHLIVDGMEYGNYHLTYQIWPLGWTLTFRREALPMEEFNTIGGFTINEFCDHAITLNLLTRGRLAFVNEVLDFMRAHDDQHTQMLKSNPAMVAEALRIMQGAKKLGYLKDEAAELMGLNVVWLHFYQHPACRILEEAVDAIRQINDRRTELKAHVDTSGWDGPEGQ